MNIPHTMIKCLIVTIIIELSASSLIIKIKDRRDIFNIILANCITNPIVVTVPIYFNYKYGIPQRNISLIILEMLTVLIEGYIYQKFLKNKKVNPYILSLLLNLSSYLIGEIINILL